MAIEITEGLAKRGHREIVDELHQRDVPVVVVAPDDSGVCLRLPVELLGQPPGNDWRWIGDDARIPELISVRVEQAWRVRAMGRHEVAGELLTVGEAIEEVEQVGWRDDLRSVRRDNAGAHDRFLGLRLVLDKRRCRDEVVGDGGDAKGSKRLSRCAHHIGLLGDSLDLLWAQHAAPSLYELVRSIRREGETCYCWR